MKVKTTFTVEIICDLKKCVERTLELNEQQALEERKNIVDCIFDALGFPDNVEITCTYVKREVHA